MVEVIVWTFKSLATLASEIDFSCISLLLFFFLLYQTLARLAWCIHHAAGFWTPSQTTLHSGKLVTAIQFYNWKTGLMLSTAGIEMTMGIMLPQTPWCSITNTGECPTNNFYISRASIVSNATRIDCFFYKLNNLPVCPRRQTYNPWQFVIPFPSFNSWCHPSDQTDNFCHAGQAAHAAGGWRRIVSISRTSRIWFPYSKSTNFVELRQDSKCHVLTLFFGAAAPVMIRRQWASSANPISCWRSQCWPLWSERLDRVNIVKIKRGWM